MKKRSFIISGLLFILLLTHAKIYAEDFKRALPGRIFSFPQDHFSHPEFKTEGWYYSGHLRSLEKNKRSYGYQLTFSRTGLTREKNQKSNWSIQDLYFAQPATSACFCLFSIENFSASGYDFFLKGVKRWINSSTLNQSW